MRRTQLPITALPAWSKLNDASFIDISVKDLGDTKGFGLATERALSSKETFDVPTLLIVPYDLILSAEAIEEHAKVDQHFKQLLDVAGGKVSFPLNEFSFSFDELVLMGDQSLKGDALLFLLMQITIGSPEHAQIVGVSCPWTEYVKMLPNSVPLPTMWTEEERVLLVGTSLEVVSCFQLWLGHDHVFTFQVPSKVDRWCPHHGCWRISPRNWSSRCQSLHSVPVTSSSSADQILIDRLDREDVSPTSRVRKPS